MSLRVAQLPRVIIKILLRSPFLIVSILKYLKNKNKFRNKRNFAVCMVNSSYKLFYEPIIEKLDSEEYHIISFGNPYDQYDYYSEFCQYFISEPLVILAADAHRFVRKKNHIRMQIFHGIASFGSIWGDRFIRQNDCLLLTSQFMKDQLTQDYYSKTIRERNIRIYEVGYHKIDSIVKLQVDVIKSDEKTILYGPTWHKDFSSIFEWGENLFRLTKELKSTFVIKLHPYLYKYHNKTYSGGINWESELKKYSIKYNQPFKLIPVDISIEELGVIFSDSDLFITDVSSLGYEFVLCEGKPIIFLGDKIKIPLGESKEKYLEYPEVKIRGRIGPIVKDYNQLKSTSLQLLDQNRYLEEIINFRKTFVYNIGSATTSVLEAVESEYRRLSLPI